VILALSAALLPAQEQKQVDLSARAKELVEKQMQEWKADGFRLEVITEKYVSEVFPNHKFVAVHFPVWPVARIPKEPLKSQNLFAVSDDRKVTHLPDSKKLEEFFKTTLKTPVNEDKTTRTWLRLRMEYVQDGYYKFKFPEKTEVLAGSSLAIATGVVEVVPEAGNSGSFKAVVRYDRENRFAGVTNEENKVKQGIRPRCQATLLLHPEPLVREIAEQDLLVMGRLAQGYVMEQRAKASDELRREIDRVWRRIEVEGR
jgi:hypothetical protein